MRARVYSKYWLDYFSGQLYLETGEGLEEVFPHTHTEYPYWIIDTPMSQMFVPCHRLMAETFIPNPDRLPVVNHKDGNKLNWKVSNLEWCDQSTNVRHAYRTGLNTHCTPEEKVVKCCQLLSQGVPMKRIAEICGISYQTVYGIKKGKRHRDIAERFLYI